MFCRMVRSFERIIENFVDQDNFTNTTLQKESLVFWGKKVSLSCVMVHPFSELVDKQYILVMHDMRQIVINIIYFIYMQANQKELQKNGAMFNLNFLVVTQSLEEIYFGSVSGNLLHEYSGVL